MGSGSYKNSDLVKMDVIPVYDWNARCVGFAAKVFAIQRAIEKLNPEMLVWVDCDSVIVDKITKDFVQEIFQGKNPKCSAQGLSSGCGLNNTN